MPATNDRAIEAADPFTPAERLRELAQDRSTAVRRAVAANPGTPPDLWETLVTDRNHLVRYAVAGNPVPAARAAVLASADDGTRMELAHQADLDAPTLTALLHDGSRKVRIELAGRTRSRTAASQLARDPEPDVRSTVAGNPVLASADLERLAGDPIANVRGCVVATDGVRPDTLTRLAHDRSKSVRFSVALHRSDRPDLLELLADDKDELVAHHAAAALARAGKPDVHDALLDLVLSGVDLMAPSPARRAPSRRPPGSPPAGP